MSDYERALALLPELSELRRELHRNPEVGLKLPRTTALVMQRLRSFGYEPQEICESGIVATVGSGAPVILLRADMDALPICEQTGLPFASENGAMHACGHDLHTTMLLGAAKLLKERETQLCGTVKLMFQPGEEIFKGAGAMLRAGVLEDPHVDAAFGLHVGADGPVGMVCYNDETALMASCDGFRITISGRASHGSTPQMGIDPINVGAHLHLALQSLIAREVGPDGRCVLTVGQFHAGSAANILPDSAVLEGTIRTVDEAARGHLVRRMREVAQGCAALFGAEAEVEMLSEVPPLICEKGLTADILRFIGELSVPGITLAGGERTSGSEDFALVTDEVPGCYLFLPAGQADESGKRYPSHNSHVRFDETVLPFGAAILAHCARRWLEDHGKTTAANR